jgi:hypothetical protein
LTFGNSFNQPINGLPDSIIHLTFGDSFDQPVDKNNLPSSILFLTFGYCFNQSVESLPNNLTHLQLFLDYNQIIDNLPYTLKELVIWHKENILSRIMTFSDSDDDELMNYHNRKKNIKKIPFGCNVTHYSPRMSLI